MSISKKAVLFILITILCLSMPAIYANEKAEKSTDASTAQKEAKKNTGIKVTFVELGSVRCIPCKKMMPIMEEIKKEYKGQVKVVFHDVWTKEGKPFAGKYKIRLIPTQVFLDENGTEYFRHEGFFPKKELVKVLKQKGVK
jgi:thioredoxin 1